MFSLFFTMDAISVNGVAGFTGNNQGMLVDTIFGFIHNTAIVRFYNWKRFINSLLCLYIQTTKQSA